MKEIIDHNYDDDNQEKIYHEKCSQTQRILRIRSNHYSKNQINIDVNLLSNLFDIQRFEIRI